MSAQNRKGHVVNDYSNLRYEALKRFGSILRDLCEVSGFTQGKLAREAKAERQLLIDEGYINPGDLIGSMEQSTVSRIMTGAQEPTFFQVFIWLRVLRKHYKSPELADVCQKMGIEKPEFPSTLERKLWNLAGFVTPKELSLVYEGSKDIQPMRLRRSMIDHKETRTHTRKPMAEYITEADVPIIRQSGHLPQNTEELPIFSQESYTEQ